MCFVFFIFKYLFLLFFHLFYKYMLLNRLNQYYIQPYILGVCTFFSNFAFKNEPREVSDKASQHKQTKVSTHLDKEKGYTCIQLTCKMLFWTLNVTLNRLDVILYLYCLFCYRKFKLLLFEFDIICTVRLRRCVHQPVSFLRE